MVKYSDANLHDCTFVSLNLRNLCGEGEGKYNEGKATVLTMQKIKMLIGTEKMKKDSWYTSRNRANAGFAWQVVFIAFLADFQLSRKSVYVSRTTALVNYRKDSE